MSEHDLEKWQGRAKPGMPLFEGPEEIRNAFLRSKGIDWTASYIDPATWIDKSRTLISATGVAFDQIQQHASHLCSSRDITVREGGERIAIRNAQEAYERSSSPPARQFAHREAAE